MHETFFSLFIPIKNVLHTHANETLFKETIRYIVECTKKYENVSCNIFSIKTVYRGLVPINMLSNVSCNTFINLFELKKLKMLREIFKKMFIESSGSPFL